MLVGVAVSVPPPVGTQLDDPTFTVTFAAAIAEPAVTWTIPEGLGCPLGSPAGFTETVRVGLLDVFPRFGVTARKLLGEALAL